MQMLGPVMKSEPGDFKSGLWDVWEDDAAQANVPQPGYSTGDMLIVFIAAAGGGLLPPANPGDWQRVTLGTGFNHAYYCRIATNTSADEFQRQLQILNSWGVAQMISVRIVGTGVGALSDGSGFVGTADIEAKYKGDGINGGGSDESIVLTCSIRLSVSSGLSFGSADSPVRKISSVANTFAAGAYFIWGFVYELTQSVIADGDFNQSPTQSEPLYGKSGRAQIT
jgi:hypothetical protein